VLFLVVGCLVRVPLESHATIIDGRTSGGSYRPSRQPTAPAIGSAYPFSSQEVSRILPADARRLGNRFDGMDFGISVDRRLRGGREREPSNASERGFPRPVRPGASSAGSGAAVAPQPAAGAAAQAGARCGTREAGSNAASGPAGPATAAPTGPRARSEALAAGPLPALPPVCGRPLLGARRPERHGGRAPGWRYGLLRLRVAAGQRLSR
jgi:hypothetical protein